MNRFIWMVIWLYWWGRMKRFRSNMTFQRRLRPRWERAVQWDMPNIISMVPILPKFQSMRHRIYEKLTSAFAFINYSDTGAFNIKKQLCRFYFTHISLSMIEVLYYDAFIPASIDRKVRLIITLLDIFNTIYWLFSKKVLFLWKGCNFFMISLVYSIAGKKSQQLQN